MFDLLVSEYPCGVVLKEKLPASPDFLNADYLFHHEKLIGELKCLTEDNTFSENNRAKVSAVIDAYYRNGRITSKYIDEDNWKKLPRDLQTRIYQVTTTAIQNSIKKANKQIRETRDRLGLRDYTGLLILANDGMISLPPVAFIHATQQILARHFSEINYFIFLTANLFTKMRGIPLPLVFWIGFDMQKGPKMDEVFANRLGAHWRGLICRKTRVPGFEMELQDIEGFWKARHITKVPR